MGISSVHKNEIEYFRFGNLLAASVYKVEEENVLDFN